MGASRTERLQTVGLGLEGAHPFVTLEARRHTYIEVEPVLDGLALGYALEEDAGMWTLDGEDRRREFHWSRGTPNASRAAPHESNPPGGGCTW